MFKKLRHLHSLVIMLLAGSILASCFSNEETDYSTYNDLVLSAITFGTIPRTVKIISATTKNDSTYESSVSASSGYPFTIDQLNNIAYNEDSLPQGTHPDKIIFSTFTVTSGSASIKMLTQDLDTTYTTTDTLDFSRGFRTFDLYGYDGSTRSYRVEVRIHQQNEDSVTWREMSLQDWSRMNLKDAPTTNEYTTGDYRFRLENGSMLVSTDGETYAEDSIETENKGELPTSNFAWASGITRADKNVKEVLLYGTVPESDTLSCRIWRRNIDLTGTESYGWEYLPVTFETFKHARGLRDAALFPYDKGYLLVGLNVGDTITIQYSQDHGRIWKSHDYLKLPKALKGVKVNHMKACMDNDSNLWLMLDDKTVWYGRAHSVGWEENKKVYSE